MLKTNFRKLLLTLIVFLFAFSKETEHSIIWSETRKLTWKDFQKQPDINSSFYALSHTGLSYTGQLEQQIFNYKVLAEFVPEKSWVKKEFASETLLAHEQLHFDISELYARKLRKAFDELPPLSEKNFDTIDTLFLQHFKAHQIMQTNYDHETEHSAQKTAQKSWEEKINKALISLKNYAK